MHGSDTLVNTNIALPSLLTEQAEGRVRFVNSLWKKTTIYT